MDSPITSFFIQFLPDSTKLLKGLSGIDVKAQTTAQSIDKKLSGSFDAVNPHISRLKDAASRALNAVSESASKSATNVRSIGVAADKAKPAVSTLAGVISRLAAPLTAILGFAALKNAIGSATDRIDALGKKADSLDIPIGDLDAWQEAAKRAGGSAEGVTSSIEALSQSAQEMAVKGTSRTLPYFKNLGISLLDTNKKAKSPIALLKELSKSFEKMSKQESLGLGKKLGLDTGTIMLLQSGEAALNKLIERQKEFGVASKEDADAAAVFNDAMADFNQFLGSTFRSTLLVIVKAINRFASDFKAIKNIVEENKGFFIAFITAISAVLTALYLPTITAAAVATWALLAPIIAIGGAIVLASAAIALVVDDLYNFLEGNESVIGQISKKWPAVGEAYRVVGDIFSTVKDIIISGFFGIIEVLDLFVNNISNPGKAFENTRELISKSIDALLKKFPMLNDIVTKVGAVFTRFKDIAISAWDSAANGVGNAIAKIKNFISSVIDKVSEAITSFKNLFGAADKAAEINVNAANVASRLPTTQPGASNSNVYNDTKNINQNIKADFIMPNGDPAAIKSRLDSLINKPSGRLS
jgi:hypothetical protein